MVKGICQKVETLSDGSVKLSVYVQKEDIQSAFPLAYQEVSVKEFEATDINKDSVIHLACQGIDKIREMLIAELINSVKPEEENDRKN